MNRYSASHLDWNIPFLLIKKKYIYIYIYYIFNRQAASCPSLLYYIIVPVFTFAFKSDGMQIIHRSIDNGNHAERKTIELFCVISNLTKEEKDLTIAWLEGVVATCCQPTLSGASSGHERPPVSQALIHGLINDDIRCAPLRKIFLQIWWNALWDANGCKMFTIFEVKGVFIQWWFWLIVVMNYYNRLLYFSLTQKYRRRYVNCKEKLTRWGEPSQLWGNEVPLNFYSFTIFTLLRWIFFTCVIFSVKSRYKWVMSCIYILHEVS